MPVEIILTIADQTENVTDAVSLALTCKDLFSILSKYIKRLDAHSTEMLLINIERDASWVVYCPYLRKLLSFYYENKIFYYPKTDPFENDAYRWHGNLALNLVCPGKSLWVTFLETRLVRNRRLFGVTHGIPLSYLSLSRCGSVSYPFMKKLCRGSLEMSRTANWIGDSLFLSYKWIFRLMGVGTTTRIITTLSLHDFLLNIGGLGMACHHCYFAGILVFTWSVLHPRLEEAEAKLSEQCAYEAMGSCHGCETDWDISISWVQDDLVFKCVTYHDLGCCSIPMDSSVVEVYRF